VAKEIICLTVNGRPYELLITANVTLVDVLRNELNLTGTKYNCRAGECGACTVLIEGGMIQGVGFALHGDFVINRTTGVLESSNFTDYKVCRSLDIPDTEVILIEKPTPTGPFGAKSVGEAGAIAIAPAIYNAVYDAIGVRIKDMPLTPERVLAGLAVKRAHKV